MLRYLITLPVLLFFFLSYAYCKDIQITADEFLIDREKNYFIAKGNVTTVFEGYTIYSDNIYYDKKSELIYIDGKIKLLNDFLIIGENLKYDLNNKEGYISNGELLYFTSDKSKQKFITGRNIIVYDKNSYYLTEGTFSSCEGEKKPWYITGKDINITLGEYLTAKNVALFADNIPFLYTPYFLAPIKKEKESGFLFPYFGFSGKNGFIMNIPYYFFLEENYDDTLTLRVRTENTVGIDNEFRYKLSKTEEGIINFSIYDNYDLRKTYTYLNFKHNKNNFFKADLNILNKRDFFYQYISDVPLKSLPYQRSIAFYEISTNRALYSINLFSGYNINLNDSDFFSFALSRKSYPIYFKKDFFYNIDGALSFYSKGNQNYEKINLSPYSIYRISSDNYDLFLKLLGHINYYKIDLNGEQKNAYLVFSPEAQTLKTYIINDKYILKNLFRFTFISPFKGFDNISIKNDIDDSFNKSKRLELTFEQNSFNQNTGQLLYNLKITQGYYLDNLYQEDSFSDTTFLLRTMFENNTFGILGGYNHNKSEFSQLSVYNDYKTDYFSLNLNYNKQYSFSEFLSLALSKKFSDKIISGVNFRYDVTEKILKETGLIFNYLKDCYSIKLDFRNKKSPSEFLVFVYINLYGLGEIKIE